VLTSCRLDEIGFGEIIAGEKRSGVRASCTFHRHLRALQTLLPLLRPEKALLRHQGDGAKPLAAALRRRPVHLGVDLRMMARSRCVDLR
jgi:hypothetical protein